MAPEELLEGLATRNLFQLSDLVMRAALHRVESRGNHHLEDFSARDDHRWLVSVVVEQSRDGATRRERPVDYRYLRPEAVRGVPKTMNADR